MPARFRVPGCVLRSTDSRIFFFTISYQVLSFPANLANPANLEPKSHFCFFQATYDWKLWPQFNGKADHCCHSQAINLKSSKQYGPYTMLTYWNACMVCTIITSYVCANWNINFFIYCPSLVTRYWMTKTLYGILIYFYTMIQATEFKPVNL